MSKSKLELWGGVECTVNRVGDNYIEQIDRLGHSSRISDLDLFAELRISALRQPVLWERIAPDGLESADWRWTDRWLARLRQLGIAPIAGLVHHGSTNLLDPSFPEKLAVYAHAVAERYPWVNAYTPINEPLTTARFSALYGHWYPHKRDERSFLSALINECRATTLAMREIRSVNPDAKLVQTDDLCKIYSTPHLQYQADFENHRRWLGYDLLCGKVTQDHPLYRFLLQSGAEARELDWFAENPCPPDIIGINHYLSSDRFLDEQIHRYPPATTGGNGREQYADVLAARVRTEGPSDIRLLLKEAWQRYHIPLALTEVHNGCTREEQLRWLLELWNGCCAARGDKIDVVALTLWSLLGAFDWNTLVTRNAGHYEPGVFDIRSPQPRATAIAHLGRALARGEETHHPLLQLPGWWKRPQRFEFGHSISDKGVVNKNAWQAFAAPEGVAPLLIVGGRGTLGSAFAHVCRGRGIVHYVPLRSEMDIAEPDSVRRVIAAFRPWAIINAAGCAPLGDAETDWKRCYRENTIGPAILSEECRRQDIRLVTFSSDLVFDGSKGSPYLETDSVQPSAPFGRSKAMAEDKVLRALPSAVVIRTSAFFSHNDERGFLVGVLRSLARNAPFPAPSDALLSPTYVPDLVDAVLDLLIDGEQGIWHLTNCGALSWADFAMAAAKIAGFSSELVRPSPMRQLRHIFKVPTHSVLSSEKARVMPPVIDAIERFVCNGDIRWKEESQKTA